MPPIFTGQAGFCADIFLNGACNFVTTFFATLPKCRPPAIMFESMDERAIAEPIVSMSPFFPVNTGTAPREQASFNHSCSATNCAALV